MEIVTVEPGDRRLLDAVLPVLRELRPHLDGPAFTEVYAEGHRQGLRFTAAFDGAECLGVAGWRVIATTQVGRKLYVDDLVTSPARRSTGVGHALLSWLREQARDLGCARLELDSGVQRHRAHRFYFREGLEIASFHFGHQV